MKHRWQVRVCVAAFFLSFLAFAGAFYRGEIKDSMLYLAVCSLCLWVAGRWADAGGE